MQNGPWMRPALQVSEAVLLPALPRTTASEPRFSGRLSRVQAEEDSFQLLPQDGRPLEELALSTYVRSRGSMAGRGVLRAAGISANPYARRLYPCYAGPGRQPSSYARRVRIR